MTLTFYSISDPNIKVSKTLGSGTTVTGAPLLPVNNTRPSFRITLDRTNMPAWNYCYVSELSRYYFIASIECTSNNIFVFRLKIDPLMSWAGSIRQSNAFVYRNENTYNTDIIDPLAIIKSSGGDVKCGGGSSSGEWLPMSNATNTSKHWLIYGTFSLVNGTAAGMAESIACDLNDAQEILAKLLTASINPVSSNSPLISISYCPCSLPYGDAVTSIGWLAGGAAVTGLTHSNKIPYTGSTVTTTWEFNLNDKHFSGDLSWGNSVSTYILKLRPFPSVQLPQDILAKATSVKVRVETNVINGVSVMSIAYGFNYVYGPFNSIATANVNYTINFSNNNNFNMFSSGTLNSFPNYVKSDIENNNPSPLMFDPSYSSNLINQASSIASGLSQVVSNVLTSKPMSTAISGSSICDLNPIIIQSYPDIVDVNPAIVGRPLCQSSSLSSLTGFTTAETHIGISGASDVERGAIESLLKSGVIL